MKKYIKDNYNRQFFYYLSFSFLFRIIPTTIDYIELMTNGLYLSDITMYKIHTQLSKADLSFIYLFVLFSYFISYLMCLFFFHKHYVLADNISISIKRKRFESVIIILLGVQIFFASVYGIGSAMGYKKPSRFTTLFNLINIDLFFYIYYFQFRRSINRNFIIITLLILAKNIVQGWSGIILTFFFMEIFFFCRTKRKLIFILCLTPCIFFVGAFVYQFIYPFKMFIRLGVFIEIDYFDALFKLINRMTSFSNTCYAIERAEKLIALENIYGVPYGEIKYFFNTILPGSFYDKNFKTFHSIINRYLTGGFGASYDLGIAYYYLLARLSFLNLILYFCLLMSSTLLSIVFVGCISSEPYRKYAYAGYYNFFTLGLSLNVVAAWIPAIFNFILLWLIGCFCIVRNNENKELLREKNEKSSYCIAYK